MKDEEIEYQTLLSAGDICGDENTCVGESIERNRESKQFVHLFEEDSVRV